MLLQILLKNGDKIKGKKKKKQNKKIVNIQK